MRTVKDGSANPAGRSLLLVLGMHRSGTSALAGVLQKLGVELGEELLPPSRDNPKGYFENARVVAAHEELFAAFHRSWQDPRPLPPRWRDSAAADRAHEELAVFIGSMFTGAAGRVAVKDPRTSRILPLWEDIGRAIRARVGAVLMLRHPNEVAASLRKRDGLSRARAHLLWMTYLLEAERASRDLPRAFASYEALLADWRGELERMRRGGLDDMLPEPTPAMEKELDTFLDVSLRSNKASEDQGEVSPFESLALELYGLGLRCASSEPPADAAARFDDIAGRLAPVAAHYLQAPLQLEQELERQRVEQARIDMSLQLAALRELWRPAFPSRPPGACRLYWRDGGGEFGETHALTADPELLGARRRVCFELPAGARVEYLRVDPDSAPGVFAIESVRLNGRAVDGLAARMSRVNELELPVTRQGDAVRFAALGEDPYFSIDARGLAGTSDAGGAPLKVEVQFRAETVLSEVGGHLEEYREGLQRHGQVLDQRQKRVDAGIQTLAKQQERMEAGLQRLSAMLEQHEQFAASLRTDLAGMKGKLDNLEAGDRALSQELALMHGELASFGKAGIALSQDLAGMQGKLDNLEAGDRALSQELMVMHERQALLLSWARRRSPGYWWGRLLGRNKKI